MAIKRGKDCKAYIQARPAANVTDWAALVWATALVNIETLTINMQKDSEEINNRSDTGFKTEVTGNKSANVSFTTYFDESDPVIELLETAYFDDSLLAGFFTTGSAIKAGTRGLRALYNVKNFSMEQPSNGSVKVSVEMSAAYDTTFTPSWHKITEAPQG